jgi:lambda family phage portal protein
MLVKYDGVELDSAIINAIFAAYLESPFDHELMREAVSDGERVGDFQGLRKDFHDAKPLTLGNARIPILFPGEKVGQVDAKRPNNNFEAFEGAMLRNVATGLGLSAQQVSNNWSDINYSSARGALLEAWKTIDRRRHDFGVNFAGQIRIAWLEESMAVDDLPLPKGAPAFLECRNAYSACGWMGPGRGWIDPVKEKQGAVLGMDAALTTLELQCAEQGLDYQEVSEQRRYEVQLFREKGLPLPQWAGDVNATQASQPSEAA